MLVVTTRDRMQSPYYGLHLTPLEMATGYPARCLRNPSRNFKLHFELLKSQYKLMKRKINYTKYINILIQLAP